MQKYLTILRYFGIIVEAGIVLVLFPNVGISTFVTTLYYLAAIALFVQLFSVCIQFSIVHLEQRRVTLKNVSLSTLVVFVAFAIYYYFLNHWFNS